jgi:hypothetical protein
LNRAGAKRIVRSASAYSLKGIAMNWNQWMRQSHRWLSIAFTGGVIVNTFAVAAGHPANWMYFLALLPLLLLLLSGLYLFALPYLAGRRVGQSARGQG